MKCRGRALGAFLLLSLALPAALMAQMDQAWVATYNGPYPKNSIDQANPVVCDAAGNVYVAGNSDVGFPNGAVYAVIKYDPSGNQIWVATYDFVPGYNTIGIVTAMTLDVAGNVYVTGYTALDATGGYGTVKFNSSGAVQWARKYRGPGSSYDYARAIAVDGSGNVYVTGYSPGVGTGNDIATVKYDASGNQQWVVRFNGPGNGNDAGSGIRTDAAGNIYVAGSSRTTATNSDCTTIKYDTNGNQLWLALYDGPTHSADGGSAIVLDAASNVYVAGYSTGSGTGTDCLTLKYSTSGTLIWAARYNNTPTNGNDYAQAIALGPSDNVYVTGYSAGSGTGDDFATIRYSATGSQIWVARYNNSAKNGSDQAWGIGVDAAGNSYVGGGSDGAVTGRDYAAVKYDAAGNQLWVARYDGPAHSSDNMNGFALSPLGNIHLTGGSYSAGSSPDIATVTYDPSGVQLWVARYNYPLASADYGQAVAMDAAGNVYVTGYITGPDFSDDYATIKYDALGNQLWVARYSGPGSSYDDPNAICVDGSGNVYVTGYSVGVGTNYDYATVKYDSAGNQQWVARYDGPTNGFDLAYRVAVDAAGNVYVTGYSAGSGTGDDYATIKYDANGNQVWLARYNGPANGTDDAYAIAVDGSGNVLVTGSSTGSGTGNDYVTVKYDANGSQLWVASYTGPGSNYDSPSGISADGSGNVYVTGYSAGSTTGNDYATVKYNSSGVQQWVARYNGTGNGADYANGIAIDGAGNVYVTGYSAGVGTGNDYATVKYNSGGVQQWVSRYTGLGNGHDAANSIGVDAAGNVYVTGNSIVASPGPWSNADCVTIMYGPDGHQMALAQYDAAGAPDVGRSIAVNPEGVACVTGYSYVPYRNIDYLTIKYFVPYGWTTRAMLPTGPSERYEGAGGWLSYNAGNKLIYAAKGENTADFYAFNPGTNAWVDLEPIPLGTELKLPHDGCRGVTDGADKVYMTKGANTIGFWSYTISTRTWTQLADVPAGKQKVKGGTDLAYVVSGGIGYVYLLKGQEREFYRYNTATNAWERLPDAPIGNWLAGSWLVFDGDHSLYAHKALSQAMYRFDVAAGTWDQTALAGMPLGESNLQLGTGGAATWLYGSIYALKGNNTSELWRYDPGVGVWTALYDVPPAKGVHMGGDITATPDVIFAFKGSKTNELWRYVPYPEPGAGGQMAGSTRLGSRCGLIVAPNPMRLGAAVSYAIPKEANVSLKLYDITGSLVKTIASGRMQAGRYAANLSSEGLARGVYVLKLATDAGSVTRKVVIE